MAKLDLALGLQLGFKVRHCTRYTVGKLPLPMHPTVPTDTDTVQDTLSANCRYRDTQLYLLTLTLYKIH